jgi:hypothetical protein
MTTLSLLHEKKQVLNRVKRGRAFVYQPIVTRDEVSRSVIDDLRGVLFQGSTRSLVLSMLADEQVSSSDIEAIKAAISQLESTPHHRKTSARTRWTRRAIWEFMRERRGHQAVRGDPAPDATSGTRSGF